MRAGEAVRAAAWVAAAGMVARHTAGAWQLSRTLTWLRHGRQAQETPLQSGRPPEVQVIVPVLREQGHVGAALAWWRQTLPVFPGMTVTFVSTAREEHERALLSETVSRSGRLSASQFPQVAARDLNDLNRARAATGGNLTVEAAEAILARTPVTRDVIDELLAAEDWPRIGHLTYPGLGRKAAQINYAARSLGPYDYLAVYDIDSRPSRDVLTATYALLSSQPHGPPVVQQHALHVAPHVAPAAYPGRRLAHAFVRGSATLQTVWTLRREIPYARRYHHWIGRDGWTARAKAGLSQPVGHGLFLRQNVLTEVGGLPETTVLDDVPTGVRFTLRAIPTVSVPLVGAVPAPDSAAEVLAQTRRWFCSYLDYPALMRAATQEGAGSVGQRCLISAVAIYRGTAWLAAGPLTAVTLAAALAPRSAPALRVTACAGVLLASTVPVLMLARARPGPMPARQIVRDSAELLAAYLLRSIGPWQALGAAVRGRHPTGTASPAPKTHRREGAPR
ncbi:Glycosyl transferase family group 2 [Nonomuraea solani]|uniref:Glycosyl transferase family group 2 n=1 Tax=Nonomuraea solani TaxID=1144553 RepID=A0A1H6EXD3_9ACTN|nr:glycosyltransferase family 2 protein [Nonomuraea solani]SEH01771.1 Glycosyl transferase family group 2 [Nonomuraea solani]